MGINFEQFVADICCVLATQAQADPQSIAKCKSGEDFEGCVVSATQAVAHMRYPGVIVHYEAGSHAFPDIVIEFPSNERYGIEVKSSSSSSSKSWKLNGNSVLGSTKQDVLDTYIIFGKTALGQQAFRYKRYEDAVANVCVTHSPRYMIDMDLAPGETFFAKSGLSYQTISAAPSPIELIKTHFNKQGLNAWWLGESAPAAIRFFSDLSPAEQNTLLGYCFVHFPEIFSDSPKKYRRAATWMAVQQSVLSPCLRDNFSASGKVDIEAQGVHYYRVSQIFKTLLSHRDYVISALAAATPDELHDNWPPFNIVDESLDSKLHAWICICSKYITQKSAGVYCPEDLLRGIMV